ncbi:hypothetical protein GCM10020219_041100 [Nonomuraea dietziae]
MKQLERTDAGEPGHAELLARLMARSAMTIAEEEGDLFLRLRSAASPEQLDELGRKVEAIKKVAPTRPASGRARHTTGQQDDGTGHRADTYRMRDALRRPRQRPDAAGETLTEREHASTPACWHAGVLACRRVTHRRGVSGAWPAGQALSLSLTARQPSAVPHVAAQGFVVLVLGDLGHQLGQTLGDGIELVLHRFVGPGLGGFGSSATSRNVTIVVNVLMINCQWSRSPIRKNDGAHTSTSSTHMAKNQPRETKPAAAVANRSNNDSRELTFRRHGRLRLVRLGLRHDNTLA